MPAFGPFQLDADRRELLRNGERFPLQAKPFDTLAYLVKHRDRVVDKQELLDNVWPGVHVEESALFQAVSSLRKALGDGKGEGERYIATIPGQGYRFVAKASPSIAVHSPNGAVRFNGFDSAAPEALPESPAGSQVLAANQRLWRRAAIAAAAIAAVLLLGTGFLRFSDGPEADSPQLRIRRLTSLEGTEWQPGWSPDGRSYAYSGATFGNLDIFVTATAGGDPLRRTFDPADDLHPRWSPDGRYIAFLSDRGQGVHVYILSPYEGPERKLADTGLHRDVALLSGLGAQPWSPDGDSLLIPRRHPDGSIAAWKIELSTGRETQLTFPAPGVEDREASWSFDGRRIAFRSRRDGKPGIWVADAEGKNERRVGDGGASPAWSPDSRFLYLSGGSPVNIRRIAVDSGVHTRITLGAGQDLFPTVAANGALAYSSFSHTLHLYRTKLSTGESERLTSGNEKNLHARVSPDRARVAFQSNRTGNDEIWVRDLKTGVELQLTNHPASDSRPDWSPDGESIVFRSSRTGGSRLWTVGSQGGAPRQVSSHDIPVAYSRTAAVEGNAPPRWSPDGSRIGYIAPADKEFKVWLTTLDGDVKPIAATGGAINFGWYLDSERILLTRITAGGDRETVAMNLTTGRERTLYRGPHYELEVAADGSAFSFCTGISHANQNLFIQHLSPPNLHDGLPETVGEPKQLTDGKGVWHVHNGGWFPDHESVIYTRDTDQADIFVVSQQ